MCPESYLGVMVLDGTSVSSTVQNGMEGWGSLSHQFLGIIRDVEMRCLGVSARYPSFFVNISLPAHLGRGSAADLASQSVPMNTNASFPTRCLSGIFTPVVSNVSHGDVPCPLLRREMWEVEAWPHSSFGYPTLGALLCSLPLLGGFVFLLYVQLTLRFPVS